MTKPRVYIAVPAYRTLETEFAKCLMRLQCWLASQDDFSCYFDFIAGDSLVSRARNSLTAKFLKTDATHLMFIDSDLIFSGEQIKMLVESSKDVVAGIYYKKSETEYPQAVLNCHPNATEIEFSNEFLADVAYVGTGFMLVKREVIESMKAAYPLNDFISDDEKSSEHDWWEVGVYHYKDGTCRYLSEDWFFCQKCLDMGIKIYADTRVNLIHMGFANYPLKSQVSKMEIRDTSTKERISGTSAVLGHPRPDSQNGSGEPAVENLSETLHQDKLAELLAEEMTS